MWIKLILWNQGSFSYHSTTDVTFGDTMWEVLGPVPREDIPHHLVALFQKNLKPMSRALLLTIYRLSLPL